MNIRKILFFAIFLLSCQSVLAQTQNSSITIKISDGKFFVSGIVTDEKTKSIIVEKIKTELNSSIDFSTIKVDYATKPFSFGWKYKFSEMLAKIKNWKSGFVSFTSEKNELTYPLKIPEKILNSEILLVDNKKVRLADFKDRLVILFFIEHWCGPCRIQAKDLQDFYKEISQDAEIIGVSFETSASDNEDFRKLVQQLKFNYDFGFANSTIAEFAIDLTGMNGIPQTLLIYNGKLIDIFAGASPKVTNGLKERVRKFLQNKSGK